MGQTACFPFRIGQMLVPKKDSVALHREGPEAAAGVRGRGMSHAAKCLSHDRSCLGSYDTLKLENGILGTSTSSERD